MIVQTRRHPKQAASVSQADSSSPADFWRYFCLFALLSLSPAVGHCPWHAQFWSLRERSESESGAMSRVRGACRCFPRPGPGVLRFGIPHWPTTRRT